MNHHRNTAIIVLFSVFFASQVFSQNVSRILDGRYASADSELPAPCNLITIPAHNGSVDDVNCLAFSPDNRYIATGGSADHLIKLWDVETGEKIREFVGHDDYILSIAFSPNGTQLLSGGGQYDPTVRLWDVNTGLNIKTFDHHTGSVYSVGFSPDGAQILTSSCRSDPTARLCDIETGETIHIFSTYSEEYTANISTWSTAMAQR